MNTRTVYACETCQPLIQGTVVAAERVKAMSAAGPTKVRIAWDAQLCRDELQSPWALERLVGGGLLLAKVLASTARVRDACRDRLLSTFC